MNYLDTYVLFFIKIKKKKEFENHIVSNDKINLIFKCSSLTIHI